MEFDEEGGIKLDPSFLEELKEDKKTLLSQASEATENNSEEISMEKEKVQKDEPVEKEEEKEEEKEFETPEAQPEEQQEEEPTKNSLDMAEDKEKEEKEEKPEGEEKEEKPEGEEKPADKEDEEEEGKEKKEKMSLTSIWEGFDFDSIANLVSDNEELRAEVEKREDANPEIILKGMFVALEASEKKLAEYKDKLEELKGFRAEVESSQKAFAVEQTLQEISQNVVIPDETREEMVAEAEKYSLENLEAWKNYCKALSFDFKIKETKKTEFTKIGMPFDKTDKNKKEDLWK